MRKSGGISRLVFTCGKLLMRTYLGGSIMNQKSKLLIALGVAVVADLIQVIMLPFTVGGGFMPWDDALDFIVAAVLTSLLGWHGVFLPTAAAKLVPFADLAPFWTLAVFIVAMRQKKEIEQPDPLPLKQVTTARESRA
jgi:hypothetical protein